MTLIKLAVAIPTLASGLWFVQAGPPPGFQALAPVTGVELLGNPGEMFPVSKRPQEPSRAPAGLADEPLLSEPHDTRLEEEAPIAKPDRKSTRAQAREIEEAAATEEIITRRLRIERILMTLDQVAAVAVQMSPEHADRIEPVVVDLAEQTLELIPDDVVAEPQTDRELTKIENTVDRLVSAMDRMVEPEASL